MTRMELLAARANDVVEVALSKGVCLSETECAIVQDAALVELVRVEREVWEKVATHLEAEAVKSLACENKLARKGNADDAANIQSQRLAEEAYAAWARAQQHEVGS